MLRPSSSAHVPLKEGFNLAEGTEGGVEVDEDIAGLVPVLLLLPRLVGQHLRAQEQNRHSEILRAECRQLSYQASQLRIENVFENVSYRDILHP